MNLGQTSLIYFLSRFLSAFLGFLATIYFARLLGADPLGIYYLVIGLVSWLAIGGQIGISGAVSKRVSEGEESEQYAIAGVMLVTTLFTIVAVGIFLFRSYVNSYVGYPAAGYIVLVLLVTLWFSIVSSLLTGLHLVHIKGLLSPLKTGGTSLLQVGAVFVGLSLSGLFLGYIAGYLLVIVVGLFFVRRHLQGLARPKKRHFRSLFDYAKFSWLGSLQSRMFNYTDVIVLGFFVPSALIGIYSIAWNIAQFLILFSGAISTTLFPEMSQLSANRDPNTVSNLLEDALSYAGLLLIPGLVGGAIIGEHLLRIYGEEFTQGVTILVVLILANLVMAYQGQILNTFNAIDRPDISFRINALFVVANVSLNVVLVYSYGWLGAAVATALSVTISLVVAYRSLVSIIDFDVPVTEISRQWIASLVMGAVVYGSLWIENTYRLLSHNAATVVILVGLGSGIYFLTLLTISSQFRLTVYRNLPVDVL